MEEDIENEGDGDDDSLGLIPNVLDLNLSRTLGTNQISSKWPWKLSSPSIVSLGMTRGSFSLLNGKTNTYFVMSYVSTYLF